MVLALYYFGLVYFIDSWLWMDGIDGMGWMERMVLMLRGLRRGGEGEGRDGERM